MSSDLGFNRLDNSDVYMVEWIDGTLPVSEWQFLEDLSTPEPVHCTSVGFLVHEDTEILVLAPNVGDTIPRQASGLIRIPMCSVTKTTLLTDKG